MAVRLLADDLKPFQQFLDEYCETYASMDVEKLSGFFSRDEVHCFGTGVDETLTTRESLFYALQRDFSELKSVKLSPEGKVFALKIGEVVVSLSADLNVSYTLASSGATASMPKLRITMVLEKQNEAWVIVDIHASAPLNTQSEGRSFPEA